MILGGILCDPVHEQRLFSGVLGVHTQVYQARADGVHLFHFVWRQLEDRLPSEVFFVRERLVFFFHQFPGYHTDTSTVKRLNIDGSVRSWYDGIRVESVVGRFVVQPIRDDARLS